MKNSPGYTADRETDLRGRMTIPCRQEDDSAAFSVSVRQYPQ